MKNNNNISKFFKCSCGSHALHFLKFEGETEVYISIWGNHSNGNMTIWSRLKFCWGLLRHGASHGDDVVLNKEDISKMGKFLSTLNKE